MGSGCAFVALSLPVGILYLLDDKGIGYLKQGMRQVGTWILHGMADCSATTDCAAITHKTLSSNFLATETMGIPGNGWHIVHQLLLILHVLPGTLSC